MSVMAELVRSPYLHLPPEREWTFADLDTLPADGMRYEIIDGSLLVSPAPWPPHQRAVLGLAMALRVACPADLEIFVAPLDYRPDKRNSLQPDLLVVRREDVGRKNIERPLLLAVEILSRTTRRRDQTLKRRVYEESGVASYWMFDPSAPSLVVCDLVDGRYVETVQATGAEEVHVNLPYPVRLCPAELAAG